MINFDDPNISMTILQTLFQKNISKNEINQKRKLFYNRKLNYLMLKIKIKNIYTFYTTINCIILLKLLIKSMKI